MPSGKGTVTRVICGKLTECLLFTMPCAGYSSCTRGLGRLGREKMRLKQLVKWRLAQGRSFKRTVR